MDLGFDHLERSRSDYVECRFGILTCLYNIKGDVMEKVRKKRKPMTPEQRAAAAERLALARAAKAPAKNISIHESIRNLDDDHPLSPAKVKAWIKSCREELKANRHYRLSKDSKEKAAWHSLESYVRNMQNYLSSGIWLDLFYGEKRSIRMYPVCTTMSYEKDGTPKYSYGIYYPGLGLYKGQGEFEE